MALQNKKKKRLQFLLGKFNKTKLNVVSETWENNNNYFVILVCKNKNNLQITNNYKKFNNYPTLVSPLDALYFQRSFRRYGNEILV